MTQYNSFEEQRGKFRELFEKSKSNSSDIKNDLKKFQIRFNPQTFVKSKTIINLLNKELIHGPQLSGTRKSFSWEFVNLPDWALNFVFIQPIFFVEDGNSFKLEDAHIKPIGTEIIGSNVVVNTSDGTVVENGDFSLSFDNYQKWWEKSNDIWELNIDFNITPTQTNVFEFGFNSTRIETFVDLDAIIINPRNYHAIQSGQK